MYNNRNGTYHDNRPADMYNNHNGTNHDGRAVRLLGDLKSFIDTNRSVDENAIHQYLTSMHDPLQDSTYRSVWREAVGYAYESITHLQQRQNAYYLRARGLAHDSWQTARGEELTRFVQDPYPRDEHGQRVRAAEVPMYDAVALDDEVMLTVAALRARLILLLRAIAIKAVMCDGLSTVIMDYLNEEPATVSPAESRGYDQGRAQRDVAPPQTPGYMRSRVASVRHEEAQPEYRIRGAGEDSGAPCTPSGSACSAAIDDAACPGVASASFRSTIATEWSRASSAMGMVMRNREEGGKGSDGDTVPIIGREVPGA
ncbi:hypothetical protein LTR35_001606 [Friedmanniomyces endolithicus]|nr:hypothetical protein LTR35_001606 [Friedmanniomyces endolithicus]KAK0296692.1 hypothetical protein LTS00_004492 [Friedmanniomyces endolithicus]